MVTCRPGYILDTLGIYIRPTVTTNANHIFDPEFTKIEEVVTSVIFEKYLGCSYEDFYELIRFLDNVLLFNEASLLMDGNPCTWETFENPDNRVYLGFNIEVWEPCIAEVKFLDRFWNFYRDK